MKIRTQEIKDIKDEEEFRKGGQQSFTNVLLGDMSTKKGTMGPPRALPSQLTSMKNQKVGEQRSNRVSTGLSILSRPDTIDTLQLKNSSSSNLDDTVSVTSNFTNSIAPHNERKRFADRPA